MRLNNWNKLQHIDCNIAISVANNTTVSIYTVKCTVRLLQ